MFLLLIFCIILNVQMYLYTKKQKKKEKAEAILKKRLRINVALKDVNTVYWFLEQIEYTGVLELVYADDQPKEVSTWKNGHIDGSCVWYCDQGKEIKTEDIRWKH